MGKGKGRRNLSRVEAEKVRKAKTAARRAAVMDQHNMEQIERRQAIKKRINKQTHKPLDHTSLQSVSQGLAATIEQCGEKVTPLSMFAAALTMLTNDSAAGAAPQGAGVASTLRTTVPYLLTLVAACTEKLSAGVMSSKLPAIALLVDRLVTEHDGASVVVCEKAYKLMTNAIANTILAVAAQMGAVVVDEQQVALEQFETLAGIVSSSFHQLRTLERSRVNSDLTCMYLTATRAMFQHVWEATLPTSSRHIAKHARHALRHILISHHMSALVQVFLDCIVEAKASIVAVAMREATALITLVFGMACRDSEAEAIEGTYLPATEECVQQVLSLFKSHVPRESWPNACTLVTTLFEQWSFLKRAFSPYGEFSQAQQGQMPVMLAAVPSTALLLRVLDKIRRLDDAKLNSSVDVAISAVSNTITVAALMDILPFNPHRDAFGVVVAGSSRKIDVIAPNVHETAQDAAARFEAIWARSYIVSSILPKVAHHDSIKYYVEEFLPRIAHCEAIVKDCTAAGDDRVEERQSFSVLQTQYVRLAAVFCCYPLDISTDSFKRLAIQLVNFLQTPLVDVACGAIRALCEGYHKLATAAPSADEEDGDDGDGDGDDDDDAEAKEFDLLLHPNDEVMNPHLFHGISQARADAVCRTIISPFSKNIMPKLCNTYEKHESSAVLNAIRAFAKVCDVATMRSIASAVGNFTPEQSISLTKHQQVTLDIAMAVLKELTPDIVASMLDNVVVPVLSLNTDVSADDDAAEKSTIDRSLQKKAYKLLADLLDCRLKDIAPKLTVVGGTLLASRSTALAGSLKVRLRCISALLDATKLYHPDHVADVIEHFIGEIIVNTRERSNATREIAMELLGRVVEFASMRAGGVQKLLHHCIAGLAGKTPMLVASSIAALGKVFFVAHNAIAKADAGQVIDMLFPLVAHTSAEIRGAASAFARTVVKLGTTKSPKINDLVLASLPKLLHAVALVISQQRVSSSSRVAMRQLLERLIKAYSVDTIEAQFPLGSRRFVHYVAKQLRRSDRQKSSDAAQQAETSRLAKVRTAQDAAAAVAADGRAPVDPIADKDEWVDMPDDADGYSDMSEDDEASALRRRRKQNVTNARGGKSGGGLLQLLGGNEGYRNDDGDDGVIEVDPESGKMRILTKEEKREEMALMARRAEAQRLFAEAKRRGTARPSMAVDDLIDSDNRKRRRTDAVVDFENEELLRLHGAAATMGKNSAKKMEAAAAAADEAAAADRRRGASRITQQQREAAIVNRAAKKRRTEADIRTGAEFASKRGAGGDMRRGETDPFAYVPLNRRFLNKRNRAVSKLRFKTVAATTLKGMKARRAHQQQQ